MKKEAVLHVPLSQFAYAYDERTIVLRLRAAKGDLKSCKVFYGDRVDPKPQIETFEKEMVCAAKDDLYDYFETVIHDRYSRLCYYFLLWDGKQEQYYYERDFSRDIPENRTEFFQFPYIRREDMFHIPSWAKDMVMYHIFPDSFATGYRTMEKQPNEQEIEIKNGEKAISGNRLGGTLSGIKANLDYLQQLGINCIYVNPVFAANSYHKYDTIDYFSIDPCLGTKRKQKNWWKIAMHGASVFCLMECLTIADRISLLSGMFLPMGKNQNILIGFMGCRHRLTIKIPQIMKPLPM